MNRFACRLTALIASSLLVVAAHAGPLDAVSGADASAGHKEALTRGAQAAVANLGKADGFMGNADVRIPLPPAFEKAKSAMKLLGMQKQADELVAAMNRAAELAVPEAKTMLVDAIKQMSVTDAKNILTGGDDSITRYFREKTQEPLSKKFLPVVKTATDKVGLAEKYNALASKGKSLGVVKEEDASIETYVTRKALDGLYHMIAAEEKALRSNPLGAGSDVLKKVFGALR
jgi:hypothetical protein